MSAVEQELLKATGLKRKKAEKDQDYFVRLTGAVQDLADDAWTKLSDGAQMWTNAAAKSINKEEEIEGFAVPEGGEGATAGSKSKGSESAKATAAKATTAEKPAGKATSGRPPISVAIKRIILDKMDITAKEISDMLLKRGYSKISEFTIVTIRSDFRNSLKVLKEQGLIDIEI